ncbi:hypothetical protein [Poseidonocella sp. HB161398]|uniref:hypothetical protein n=1 Tax=Poseidonocella sp. HB161398 TaxID=2320855 RepID=UPI001109DF60|nr:hypothetical protein [Poseidonocella sp. HB161398]
MTATEFAFPGAFFAAGNRVRRREDLLRLPIRRRAQFESRHLDTTAARLRRKTEAQTGRKAPFQSICGVGCAVTALPALR